MSRDDARIVSTKQLDTYRLSDAMNRVSTDPPKMQLGLRKIKEA